MRSRWNRALYYFRASRLREYAVDRNARFLDGFVTALAFAGAAFGTMSILITLFGRMEINKLPVAVMVAVAVYVTVLTLFSHKWMSDDMRRQEKALENNAMVLDRLDRMRLEILEEEERRRGSGPARPPV